MLEKLVKKYQDATKSGDWNDVNVGSIFKQRQIVYLKIQDDVNESKIIEESKAYLDLVKQVLLNTNKIPSKYINTLEYMTNVVPNNVSSDAATTIMQYQYESLNQLFRQLKKHPMQAGIRVRFVKEAMKEVKVTLDSINEEKTPDQPVK